MTLHQVMKGVFLNLRNPAAVQGNFPEIPGVLQGNAVVASAFHPKQAIADERCLVSLAVDELVAHWCGVIDENCPFLQ